MCFCGSTYSFDGEERGFLGCIEDGKLKWCKIVRGAGYLSRILIEDEKIYVCGEYVSACFDLEGSPLWMKRGKPFLGLTKIGELIAVCGQHGSIVVLNKDNHEHVSKQVFVLEASGTRSSPFFSNIGCFKDMLIIVGTSPRAISRNSKEDCVIACFNSSLEPVWALSVGDSERNLLTGVHCEDNNIFVCGSTKNKTTGKYDILVACFAENGELEWCTIIGGRLNEEAYGICSYNNILYVVGYTESGDLGGHDGFVVVLNKKGELLKSYIVGGSLNEGFSAVRASEKGLLLIGYTESAGFGKSTGLILQLPYKIVETTIQNKLKLKEWKPVAKQWSPQIKQIELKTSESVLKRESFITISWTPKILA